ncbi:hypothetical protein COM24_29995 [Bacillus toyonensis]|uniref:hypothetical protein n=1 Tax=Bacillus toyonensis TaxID=155322 RepID=UPI000BF06607|nr:hypothetical protein [Bacillus toyonensis]PEK39213.1 hypothetical protein CN586_29095 [Bacillus toyonensis]PGC45720.1 hypothetical protein COM24_29995 [Bacillus toyonensis]PHE81912.1 hypothetical protein COF80_30105 [Bacillus toyonensis]
MLKKKLRKLGVGALALGVMIPSTAAFAEESTTLPAENVNYEQTNFSHTQVSEDFAIEIYDKDKNLVKVYNKEELAQFNPQLSSNAPIGSQNNAINPLALKTTSFNSASFSDYVWIKSGVAFKKPQSVAVETSKYIKGLAVALYVDNTYWGEAIARGEFTGGLNIPTGHLTGGQDYFRIKLINRGGGRISIDSGLVFHQ